jgi:SAM-dependent methyltransferase
VRRTRLALIVLAVICGGGPSGLHLGAQAEIAAQQDRGRRLFKPEELGELEGPDRDAWQKPDLIMDALRIGESSVVADVGAGGGWFTVRLARRVGPNGKVYAEDIQPEMLAAIRRRVLREGFNNVLYVQGKTADPSDPGLPASALDAVLIVDATRGREPGEPAADLGACPAGGPHG